MSFASDRRQMLKTAALCGSGLLAPAPLLAAEANASAQAKPLTPNSIPVADLPRHYDVEPGIHNLENGYWSIMPRVVAQAFERNNAFVNRTNAIWARGAFGGDNTWTAAMAKAQAAVAQMVGCLPEEIAITRSGSDSLQMLIANYKALKPGGTAICCDLDYDSTLFMMDWLSKRRGIDVVRFTMPEPATTENVLAAYEGALKATPEAKLLIVTQVSHRTGLVTPVREIVAMARARGVDTIVDAAHAVACLDFQLDDLGADFVAWSLHKWTSCPLGTGAMFIRKSRLADIETAYENHHEPVGDINSHVPAGTINFANVLTIPDAVDFHFAVGAAAKERHLRSLRDRWVHAVQDLPNVEIMVPDDPARHCAITSFRLAGMKTLAQAKQLQKQLFDKHRVHTIWREGIDKGPVIRVTPGLYTTEADVDALAKALRAEHAMFV